MEMTQSKRCEGSFDIGRRQAAGVLCGKISTVSSCSQAATISEFVHLSRPFVAFRPAGRKSWVGAGYKPVDASNSDRVGVHDQAEKSTFKSPVWSPQDVRCLIRYHIPRWTTRYRIKTIKKIYSIVWGWVPCRPPGHPVDPLYYIVNSLYFLFGWIFLVYLYCK